MAPGKETCPPKVSHLRMPALAIWMVFHLRAALLPSGSSSAEERCQQSTEDRGARLTCRLYAEEFALPRLIVTLNGIFVSASDGLHLWLVTCRHLSALGRQIERFDHQADPFQRPPKASLCFALQSVC